MENASKALIIAGAILLSILLISLGIMVYNNAKGTVNDANLDAETAQAFNAKWTPYKGTQRGTQLNTLIELIRTHNATNSRKVKIAFNNLTPATDDETTINGLGTFANSASAAVSFTYSGGYITTISIAADKP
jgi:hypothetical protein